MWDHYLFWIAFKTICLLWNYFVWFISEVLWEVKFFFNDKFSLLWLNYPLINWFRIVHFFQGRVFLWPPVSLTVSTDIFSIQIVKFVNFSHSIDTDRVVYQIIISRMYYQMIFFFFKKNGRYHIKKFNKNTFWYFIFFGPPSRDSPKWRTVKFLSLFRLTTN